MTGLGVKFFGVCHTSQYLDRFLTDYTFVGQPTLCGVGRRGTCDALKCAVAGSGQGDELAQAVVARRARLVGSQPVELDPAVFAGDIELGSGFARLTVAGRPPIVRVG